MIVATSGGSRPAGARGCAASVEFRWNTTPGQQTALALPTPKAAELSKRLINLATKTPERSWLGHVSAVALQQSLRDAETAFKNFFGSISGKRAATSTRRSTSRRRPDWS
ncbi:hypothetical protein [Saccharopolyspora erythraea]|uniref:hypothetical protein n=1 Tax=Saccharopolyspora erythraea TaxID=1836 RepID=UPI0002DCB96D|nr:hypothetical protein [Saccharopolyspora erythraea]QRK92933.1 hypothetical protein JQX30_17565 [Saccharopolyspora erythraea]